MRVAINLNTTELNRLVCQLQEAMLDKNATMATIVFAENQIHVMSSDQSHAFKSKTNEQAEPLATES